MDSITPPPVMARKFSSQFPQAAFGDEPVWGIIVSHVGPCATCGRPTRWTDRAHGKNTVGELYHFCSEACLDERLDMEMKVLGPWPTKVP